MHVVCSTSMALPVQHSTAMRYFCRPHEVISHSTSCTSGRFVKPDCACRYPRSARTRGPSPMIAVRPSRMLCLRADVSRAFSYSSGFAPYSTASNLFCIQQPQGNFNRHANKAPLPSPAARRVSTCCGEALFHRLLPQNFQTYKEATLDTQIFKVETLVVSTT